MPHFAASDCVHDTMPLVLWTTLRRLANLEKTCASGGVTDAIVRGILIAWKGGSFIIKMSTYVRRKLVLSRRRQCAGYQTECRDGLPSIYIYAYICLSLSVRCLSWDIIRGDKVVGEIGRRDKQPQKVSEDDRTAEDGGGRRKDWLGGL